MAFKFDRSKMKYLTNPDDYKSNWEWTKSNSNYHFDKNTVDGLGETFRVCGTFHGDWEAELQDVIDSLDARIDVINKIASSTSDNPEPITTINPPIDKDNIEDVIITPENRAILDEIYGVPE